MALTINNVLPRLHPLYSDRLFITANEPNIDTDGKYIVTINIDGRERKQDVRPRPDGTLNINLSTILSRLIESKFHINSKLIEAYPDLVYSVTINIEAQDASGTEISSTSIDQYVFCGHEQSWEYFDINDYITYQEHKANWLSTWKGDRKISMDSAAYLSTFNGNFQVIAEQIFSGIKVKVYQKGGEIREVSFPYEYETTPSIVQIAVSPRNINQLDSNIIDDNTLYYTVEDIAGLINPVKFLMEKETMVNKVHNFLYLNSYGTIEFYNFTKAYEEELDFDKDIVDRGFSRKVYNTMVEQKNTVVSDWMSVQNSQSLKDFWSSPKVKLYFETGKEDIIPPTAPLWLQAENITSQSAKITWVGGSNDPGTPMDIGIKGFNLYLNGVKQNQYYITDRFFYVHGLTEGTEYQIDVYAYDYSNNQSPASSISFTTILQEEEIIPLNISHNIEVNNFHDNDSIQINFDQPVTMTDGSEITDANLWQIIQWSNISQNYEDVDFNATISADKQTVDITIGGFGSIMSYEWFNFVIWPVKGVDTISEEISIEFQTNGSYHSDSPHTFTTISFGEAYTPDPVEENPDTIDYDLQAVEKEADFRDVIIMENSKPIHNKLKKLINYDVKYQFAAKYKSFRQ